MFTYSHANMPLGQSERAYYLSYFIIIHIAPGIKKMMMKTQPKSNNFIQYCLVWVLLVLCAMETLCDMYIIYHESQYVNESHKHVQYSCIMMRFKRLCIGITRCDRVSS